MHPTKILINKQQFIENLTLIRNFTCTYNGVEVFKADLYPGVGANPLITFTTIATETGTLEFKWTGDDGYEALNQTHLQVS